MVQHSISIIILTYRRVELLKNCLAALDRELKKLSLTYEVCIAINGQDQDTSQYLDSQGKEYLQIDKALEVGRARNELIKKAKNSFLFFLDDDVEIPLNYFENITEYMDRFDCFGGPDQSPKDRSLFQESLNNVMRSYWAMGPTKQRHVVNSKSIRGNEKNLILCNLWIKRHLLDIFPFPEGYVRNEENIVLAQLEQNNFKIGYVNDLFVFHHRKKSLMSLARATFYSGRYRVIGFFDEPSTFSIQFLFPLIALSIFLLAASYNIKYGLILLMLYLIFVFLNSVQVNMKKMTFNLILIGCSIFITYHLAYALGTISGSLHPQKRE